MSERIRKPKSSISKIARVGLSTLAIAGGSFLSGCGDKVTYKEAKNTARVKYDDAFSRASPAGKFVLQYLATTTVVVQKSTPFISGPDYYVVDYNNACLSNTAYDIAGGSIKGYLSGLFSSGVVEGRVPTAAAYASWKSQKPDEILVRSGHANSTDLRFVGVDAGKRLVPADEQTQDILKTYGCQTGQVRHTVEHAGLSLQSEYIK